MSSPNLTKNPLGHTVAGVRNPNVVGVGGAAWDVTAARATTAPAVVSAWLIHARLSPRPLWPWHLLIAIALDARYRPGPPQRLSPDCTHEIALCTVDPRIFVPRVLGRAEHGYPLTDPEPDSLAIGVLSPADAVVQVVAGAGAGAGDRSAIYICSHLVASVVSDGATPTPTGDDWNARVSRAVQVSDGMIRGADDHRDEMN